MQTESVILSLPHPDFLYKSGENWSFFDPKKKVIPYKDFFYFRTYTGYNSFCDFLPCAPIKIFEIVNNNSCVIGKNV